MFTISKTIQVLDDCHNEIQYFLVNWSNNFTIDQLIASLETINESEVLMNRNYSKYERSAINMIEIKF